jgi:hypothetical protein
VIVWELIENQIPWKEYQKTSTEFLQQIQADEIGLITYVNQQDLPRIVFNLLQRCLSYDQQPEKAKQPQHPSFADIVNIFRTYLTIPEEFICPIRYNLMVDPVICADGYTYDQAAITEWLESHDTSPLTNEILSNKDLIPNQTLRQRIEEFNQSEQKI